MNAMQDLLNFQSWFIQRWTSGTDTLGRSIAALGLAGETGEAVDCVKKALRGYGFKHDDLVLELGDVLHYWVILCWLHGIDPAYVIQRNIQKLVAKHGLDGRSGEVAAGKPLDPAFVAGAGI